jgi:hypothetical protein
MVIWWFGGLVTCLVIDRFGDRVIDEDNPMTELFERALPAGRVRRPPGPAPADDDE